MTNTESEFYANGYDDGFYGHEMVDSYAPGTAAYNDYFAGYSDGAVDATVEDDEPDPYDDEDGLTDVEADAMTLAGAGWGTDEDYGFYGDDYGE